MCSLPLYKQLPNCCGLSTFLMLINPEQNNSFKKFLSDLYFNIQHYKKENIPEFQWSVVLNYLLLKSLEKNSIYSFLKQKLPEIMENYVPIMKYKLGIRHSERKHRISKYLFRKSLYSMRTDADLKILFTLFGGAFYPQEQAIWDGTGSLYFTGSDFKHLNLSRQEKIRKMESHISQNTIGKVPAIALNKGHHWVAIESVDLEQEQLAVNNPLGSRQMLSLKWRVPNTYRFYFFSYNARDAYILKKNLDEI